MTNVVNDNEHNPVLACQDHFIRVLQGSELYFEVRTPVQITGPGLPGNRKKEAGNYR